MVIDHEFKPSHCTRCRKRFGEFTEQYETPFSESTDGGNDWQPQGDDE
jgi:hypothetical protein